jgi:two-component sensor histidine kinase
VPTLAELARTLTSLVGDELAHVQRLSASWQLLSDLCFGDLLLLAPISGEEGHRFVVLGQARPTTGQTLYPADMVGTVVDEVERPLVSRAWRDAKIVDGEAAILGSSERARLQCIPVKRRGRVVALVTRETALTSTRRSGELERIYTEVFDSLAQMITDDRFPFEIEAITGDDSPRVGDGVIVLDADRRMRFASPNAVSSLHRLGIHAYTTGLELRELGFGGAVVATAFEHGIPSTEEIERGDNVILSQAIPLFEHGRPSGAMLLLRDVSDLRRRDRMLLSKDATIREIHHRVKNNLQTIAALLRLQGRRVKSPEALEAIVESERRIRSIAIVHETLSREAGDVVDLSEIVRPLVRIVEDSVRSEDVRLTFDVVGDAGEIAGEVATPLAVVLNELMQNAVDHAYPHEDDGPIVEGRVLVRLGRTPADITIDVIDDGVGITPDFNLDAATGLGLSIVRTLVTTELSGSITFHADHGTHVHIRVPVQAAPKVEL